MHLQKEEVEALKINQYEIEERRIPKSEKGWDFAVSQDNIYFTQLISDSWEMREYEYWYLYFTTDKYCLIYTNGRNSINGKYYCNGKVIKTNYDESELKKIYELANEAMMVVSYNHDGLNF